MAFRNVAGTAIIPLMSRVVLALAFTTAGYNKLATKSEFSPQQADVLRSLGVAVETPPAPAMEVRGKVSIVPASFQETVGEAGDVADEPQDTGGEGADAEPAGDEEETSGLRIPAGGEGTPDAAAGPGGAGLARSMHHVTLLCHDAGWPQAGYLALLAALTELVGGGLLLVGFLSRIWAFGLAIAMGVAFYLVSVGKNDVLATSPFVFATNIGNFNTLFSQLGLFVLSFGVLLTGAGPLSVDRFLFGGRRGGGRKGLEASAETPMAPAGGRPV